MMEMIFGALYVWGAPVFARAFSLSAERVGSIIASALIISGLLGPAVGGTLADRFQRTGGPERTMSVVGLLALVGMPLCLFGFVPVAGLAGLLFVALMTIVSAAIVMGTAIFTVVTPVELRGLCMAVWFAAATLFGLGVAPVSVSALSNMLGGQLMLGKALSVFSLAGAFLGASAFVLSSRTFDSTPVSQRDEVPHPQD